ncbi:TPA: hypothetical protein HA265_04050 [Candidatus Woesearchaeota archaeon]|nr:hypothetical protein [Candidatus Woesearchaeota archaeon]
MDYHKVLDAAKESNGNGIGSTKSGIGPFYMDNANRTTRITFGEYVGPGFHDKLRRVIDEKSDQLRIAGIDRLDEYIERLIAEHDPMRRELAPFRENLEYRMQEYMRGGHHIIVEGAQGANLHVDMGTLPYVTSSHLLAPELLPGLGLSRKDFLVYLVEKFYPTRVGAGILPTLVDDQFCNALVGNAGEIGATTRRPRRCGYPDWALIRQNVMLNDADYIILTRVDNVQDETVRVGVGYVIDGGVTEEVPLYMEDIERVVWHDRTYNFHLFDAPKDLSTPEEVDAALAPKRQAVIDAGWYALPRDLRDYVDDHDRFVGCPTVALRVGPARGETVYINREDDARR